MPIPAARAWAPALLEDGQLSQQCRWDAFRGSGPGGQKRNKTSSSIRVTHVPTGLSAIAGESRSQARNKAAALARLRHRMVLELREPIDAATFTLPRWFSQIGGGAGLAAVGRGRSEFIGVLGVVLDVLAGVGWSVSSAARLLEVSTAGLVKFLAATRRRGRG